MAGDMKDKLSLLSSIITASGSLSSILDMDQLPEKVTDLAMNISGAQRGFLFLYPHEYAAERKLMLVFSRGGGSEDQSASMNTICMPIIKKVEDSGSPLLINDTQKYLLLNERPSMRDHYLRSVLCIPLTISGRTLGLVYLDNNIVSIFDADKVDPLRILLAQAAISIENARATMALKVVQAELKQYAATMEQKVKDRTLELEKLLEKVKEANNNKTQFVSDVSHELRTPLASIKGYVSTIRNDKDMEENTKSEFLGIVEEETDRLTRIINQLLDISRIEAGRIQLNIKNFGLPDVIHKNIENIKEMARSRDIKIEEKINEKLPLVCADQDKTAQVLVNLLCNAVKYNRTGGRIIVRAEGDGEGVRVEIEDTGFGISEKDIPHMFEKFYRVDSTSDQAPGTGLGLAVTKSLIEVMGGKICVESKVGEGSKFTFVLPKGADN
jgi:signal transduction histidine kinase